MRPDGVTDEQRRFVERATDAWAQMRRTLVDAAAAYIGLDPAGHELDEQAREQALDWVERIAVDWREAEQAGATHATFEQEFAAAPPHRLLEAIQDSLILALSADPTQTPRMVTADEATNRIADLAEDGALTSVDIRPRHEAPTGNPDEFAQRFDELETLLLETISDAAEFFPRVAPEEGPFTERKRAVSRERLVELAACGRELDQERDLIAALVERRDLRPSIAVLRSMVQAFVLRLSDDPDRHAQAIPLRELAERCVPVWEDWETWETRE